MPILYNAFIFTFTLVLYNVYALIFIFTLVLCNAFIFAFNLTLVLFMNSHTDYLFKMTPATS